MRLLIPAVLVALVVFAAFTSRPDRVHAKPTISRSLQIQR
jgi:hypothetical protein